jgi:hypothetical protein
MKDTEDRGCCGPPAGTSEIRERLRKIAELREREEDEELHAS